MEQYILALDQGTTSSRALVFDHHGKIKSVAQREFKQYYPQPGWVEHDAGEIWASQAEVAADAIINAGIDNKAIAAIGITNQRETTLVWDRSTGEPIHHAIVWQDRRTAEHCEKLKAGGRAPLVQQKTGLIIDAYFSATKIGWLLDNVAGARKKANAGQLAFGTVDSWLIWKLTGGTRHVTDVTNASRTMLFNIHDCRWDEELLDLFDIPAAMLPKVLSSSEVYAQTSAYPFTEGIPIAGIAGDQQAALFGQMCTEPGMLKNTYGTGCFVVLNTGTTPVQSQNNLLTTIAWQIGDQTSYALEGSIFIAGAVVQWLRDGLKLIRSSSEIEQLANTEPDNGGVFFVPAFAGLGAPHWDQFARGTIVGMTRGTTAGHIARAALESIAFQTADVLDAMHLDSGVDLRELRVDGGASVNNTLMQFQADVLDIPVIRPTIQETTALGAAYLAGLAVKFWDDLTAIKSQWQADRTFNPTMSKADAGALLQDWQRALARAKDWIRH